MTVPTSAGLYRHDVVVADVHHQMPEPWTAYIPGLRSDFSTDGSEEDLKLTSYLVAVPDVFLVGRASTLPRRQGSIDLSWLAAAQGGAGEIRTADLERIISGLDGMLNAERFDMVDSILRHLNPTKMAIETMIAFLRVPFMARHRLHEWRKFRDRARDEFLERRVDADRLLRGLA